MKETLQKFINELDKEYEDEVKSKKSFNTKEFNYAASVGRENTLQDIILDLCATFDLEYPERWK